MGNARGLAKVDAAAIGEVDERSPLLDATALAESAKPHTSGVDAVTGGRDQSPLR